MTRYLCLLPSFFLGLSAAAWTHTAGGEGCANSEAGARERARRQVNAIVEEYRAVCEKESGSYAYKLSDGYCFHDGSDFHCPVRCNIIARMTCT